MDQQEMWIVALLRRKSVNSEETSGGGTRARLETAHKIILHSRATMQQAKSVMESTNIVANFAIQKVS